MSGMGQATPPVAGGPEPRPSSEKPHQQLGRKLPQGKSGNTQSIAIFIDLTRVQITKIVKIYARILKILKILKNIQKFLRLKNFSSNPSSY